MWAGVDMLFWVTRASLIVASLTPCIFGIVLYSILKALVILLLGASEKSF